MVNNSIWNIGPKRLNYEKPSVQSECGNVTLFTTHDVQSPVYSFAIDLSQPRLGIAGCTDHNMIYGAYTELWYHEHRY